MAQNLSEQKFADNGSSGAGSIADNTTRKRTFHGRSPDIVRAVETKLLITASYWLGLTESRQGPSGKSGGLAFIYLFWNCFTYLQLQGFASSRWRYPAFVPPLITRLHISLVKLHLKTLGRKIGSLALDTIDDTEIRPR
jgi:hypothetical protein